MVDKTQKFLTLWLCYHPEARLEGTDSTDLQKGVAFRPLVDNTTYIKECQGKPLWLHADEFLFVLKVVTVLCYIKGEYPLFAGNFQEKRGDNVSPSSGWRGIASWWPMQ